MAESLRLGDHSVGLGEPCFVIAEAGVNHNGDLDLALRLVDAAADAGADAVKFQTFSAHRLATATAPKATYQRETTDAGESQREMLRRLELPARDYDTILRRCRERGLLFLSSPFDEESADFLVGLGVAALKIPSGELTNLPFLEHVSGCGLPLILSTGMATLTEVETAVDVIQGGGAPPVILLHCVSSYPAPAAEANLRAMATMSSGLGLLTGYSDHTRGHAVALAAVALGAHVLERHLTLDRDLPGPDQRASLEPEEFAELIRDIRTVEAALGDGVKRRMPSEEDTAAVARKSIVAARDLPAGTVLDVSMLRMRRPGTGLSPSMRSDVVGRTLDVEVREGTLLELEMLR